MMGTKRKKMIMIEMMRHKLISWQALQEHYKALQHKKIPELFHSDPARFKSLSIIHDNVLIDYSKQRISSKTLELLCDLARECDVEYWRDCLFNGHEVNNTERKAALHTALRDKASKSIMVNNSNVLSAIKVALNKMLRFSESLRRERKFKHIVNIGIGGAHLGPYMVCEALKPYSDRGIDMHFVTNIDPAALHETLLKIDPHKTLFIICSKSFKTQETIANAVMAKAWLEEKLGLSDVSDHFVAATENNEAAINFGIKQEHIFPIWEWVGGRFSLWSSMGLTIAISIGAQNFQLLLDGASSMDHHFLEAPLEKNIPVILAMVGIWNINFEGHDTHAILPYNSYLHGLPRYIQQLDMESNGKSVTKSGQFIQDYKTGPIIIGQSGTQCQHSFFQLFHQGTKVVPADFIVALKSSLEDAKDQYKHLISNALAQVTALSDGANEKAPWNSFGGNRPTNMIVLPELNPYYLGMLLALYEHKIFIQGIVWDINSFDQPGVELGKNLEKDLYNVLFGSPDQSEASNTSRKLIDDLKSRMSSSH